MLIGVHEFWSFMLVFSRVTALFLVAPVFGHRAIPKQVKIGMAALISFGVLPLVAPGVAAYPRDLFTLAARVGSEVAVGVSLGFLVVLVFSALQVAGSFIDSQMGFGIINTLNPMSEQQSSAMGQFVYQLGMTLFLILGGHLFLISTLAGSYAMVPAGGAHFSGDLSGAMTGFVGGMFILAFKVAAPAAAVLLVVDVAFGIVARTVPQMNIFIVGMPLKVIVGLSTVALVLPAVAIVIAQMVSGIGGGAHAVLQAAR